MTTSIQSSLSASNAKPSLPDLTLGSIPLALREFPNWIYWAPKICKGTWTKTPYSARDPREHGSSTRPGTWAPLTDLDRHLLLDAEKRLGLGFVINRRSGVVGIDLDDCRDPVTGTLAPWAAQIVERFQGTYMEVSPSGTGLKIFAFGSMPGAFRKSVPVESGKLEVFDDKRYFTVTTQRLNGCHDDVTLQQEAIDWLVAQHNLATPKRRAEPCEYVTDADIEHQREVAIAALAQIDDPKYYDDYQCWITAGLICRSLGDDMFEHWDAWSCQDPEDPAATYDADVCERKWATFEPTTGHGGATVGTLVHWARECHPNWNPPGTRLRINALDHFAVEQTEQGDTDRTDNLVPFSEVLWDAALPLPLDMQDRLETLDGIPPGRLKMCPDAQGLADIGLSKLAGIAGKVLWQWCKTTLYAIDSDVLMRGRIKPKSPTLIELHGPGPDSSNLAIVDDLATVIRMDRPDLMYWDASLPIPRVDTLLLCCSVGDLSKAFAAADDSVYVHDGPPESGSFDDWVADSEPGALHVTREIFPEAEEGISDGEKDRRYKDLMAILGHAELTGSERKDVARHLKATHKFDMNVVVRDLKAARAKQEEAAGYPKASKIDPPIAVPFVLMGYAMDGCIGARFWRGNWYTWTDGKYVLDDTFEIQARAALRAQFKFVGLQWAASVIDAAKAECLLRRDGPCWLDGSGPDLTECIFTPSQIIHLGRDGVTTYNATPRAFSTCAVDYEYDPDAPEPRLWIRHLRETFGGDQESIVALQMWAGYLLGRRTNLQKALLFLGPAGAGKGVILETLAVLIGYDLAISTSIASLAGTFGLAGFCGRTLATIADGRIGKYTDVAGALSKILEIVGEDRVAIEHKFVDGHESERLSTRFIYTSNCVPTMPDESGALDRRWLILGTNNTVSKPDKNRKTKLLAELPGILNWAIDGHYKLRDLGHIPEPKASAPLRERSRKASNPTLGFIDDCCVLGPEESVPMTALYDAYKRWCESVGVKHRSRRGMFESLSRTNSSITEGKTRPKNGPRVPVYRGIGLSESHSVADFFDDVNDA